MKTIAIKSIKDDNIISSINTHEFVGILRGIDSLVRNISSKSPIIDYSKFYDIDIWNISTSPLVQILWEYGYAYYAAECASAEFIKVIRDKVRTLKQLKPLTKSNTIKDENDIIAEEVHDVSINWNNIAAKVIETNINNLADTIADNISMTILPPSYFNCVTGPKYWLNIEYFINSNWSEIYTLIEEFANAENTGEYRDIISEHLINDELIQTIQTLYTEAGF